MNKTFLLFLTVCCLIGGMDAAWGQLSGTYSIGATTIPGEAGNYASLSAAVAALNSGGVSGPVAMYFTESITYTDTAVSLGCIGTSATNTITFKPYTGVTATISFTSEVSKNIDGMWVIGSPNNLNTNLVSTHHVTIDGSNTIGGATKDLTILGPTTTTQRSVFRIFGNSDYTTIKNCIITSRSSSGSSTAPIQFTNYNASSVNYTPDNYTIQNNTLSSVAGNGGLGVFLSNSGTPTVGMTGVTVSNDTIYHRGTRAVMCNYVNDANIFGNTISADIQAAGVAAASIWLSTGTGNAGTFNVYGNKFIKLKTLNNTAGTGFGIIAIDNQLASPKVVNIYNNFISGFETVTSNSNAIYYGIRHTGGSTSNISHNTISFADLTDMTTFGTSRIAGIAFATHNTTEASPTGTTSIMNNIVVSDETSMKVWAVRRVGTAGTFSSNYNDLYYNPANASGFVGFWDATDQQLLADWQTASSQDANSKSKAVTFESATNLHLFGSSIGDTDLAGIAIPSVTTDIDGEARPGNAPYMGADERPESPLPVQLTSFIARVDPLSNSTVLHWTTASEVNNYGFYVQRKSEGGQFADLPNSFVAGHGTTNEPQSYTWTDLSVTRGTWYYRLKQVDLDHSVHYSDPISVTIVTGVQETTPQVFSLSQNYPNPFNPSTTIRFEIAKPDVVTLKVYDVLGREVATLVNEQMSAGNYSISFNAANLASGTYVYRLQVGNFVSTKKMNLTK